MIRNYFKTAWRTLTRNKVYTSINVLGLMLGICACMTIWVIMQYEFSFDRFHPNGNRIFRINTAERLTKNDPLTWSPAVLPSVGPFMRREVPGIENLASYHILFDATVRIPSARSGQTAFLTAPVVAGPEYFDIMQYDWLAGDRSTALAEPGKAVLTVKKTRQYFGNISFDEVIGRELVYNDSVHVRVAGIVSDWTENTDFPFTEFISLATARHSYLGQALQLDQIQWKGVPYSSRVLLKLTAQAKPAAVDTALSRLFRKNFSKGVIVGLALQPLTSVHFTVYGGETEMRTANLPTLYALLSIAVFILILAIINYVNLSTAQSLSRDKEIGIRKVLGSSSTGVLLQFLSETFLLSLLAVCLAALLIRPVLTTFHDFVPASVRFEPFSAGTILFLGGITVVTTLLAGLYPAKLLSSYLPALILKGAGGSRGGEKWLLRKGLIVFQFTISLVFIIGTLVISRQISFMSNKGLGFKSDAVVLLETNESRNNLERVKLVAEKMRQLPGVSAVARENMPPMGLDYGMFTIQYLPVSEERIPVAAIKADENFIPLYNIRLTAGRNLVASDTLKEVVVNASLAKLLGFKNPDKIVGQSIYTWDKPCPVVGVVADFHQASFRENIRPMLITSMACTDIAVKLDIKGKSVAETKAILMRMEQQWKVIYPHTPFAYTFLDDSLAQLYKREQTISWLMTIATGIAIFISCIGLLGLIMFTTERRTREIGIRKVLGAGVPDITALLAKDFIALVLVALLIASPIAWLFMHRWLQGFAYRVPFGPDIFLLAGITVVLITVLTIGFHSLKAALANPVKSLRTEG